MEIWSKILDLMKGSPRNALVFLGIAALIVAIFGGIDYKQIAPLHDPESKIALALVGVVLFPLGMFMYFYEHRADVDSIIRDDHGIEITHPSQMDLGRRFEVKGTFKKPINPKHKLMIFRMYENEKYVPVGEGVINSKNKTWSAADCDIAGNPGDRRKLAVYLVGPSGLALLAYHRDIEKFYNSVRDKYATIGSEQMPYLPPIEVKTRDMRKCSEVSVVRS